MTAPARHVSPDVSVTVDVDDARLVARVRGTVDFTTVSCVRDRLLELARGGSVELLVDVSDARLDDPTGPAALLHVYDVCRLHGVAFGLRVDAGSPAEHALRGCGLLTLLAGRGRA